MEGRVASKKREQEQNKDDKGANKKRRIKHEVISEDWGEQTQVGDTTPPGSSEANKEPPTCEGAIADNKGAADIPPPPPCRSKEGNGGSSSAIPEASGSQWSRQHLKQRLQTSIKLFAVPKPPEPAGDMDWGEEETGSSQLQDSIEGNSKEEVWGGGAQESKEERREKPLMTSEASGTLSKEQENEEYPDTLTPSMGVAECKITRKGYCNTHGDQAEQRVISSQVWKDRGGGRGYGYVTRKVKKYVCKKRVITIPHLSDASKRKGLVINNTKKSRNLSEPGHDRNILTGFMGTCSAGFESENLLDQDGLPEEEKTGR